jgi:hypothetical protein
MTRFPIEPRENRPSDDELDQRDAALEDKAKIEAEDRCFNVTERFMGVKDDFMNEPRLCKDCKYFSAPICRNELSRRLPVMDFVHGGERPIADQFYTCAAQRLGNRDCGEKGKWFEPNLTK